MRGWQAFIVVILAAIAAMFPIVSNHFVHWDDPDTIFQNPALDPPTWHSVQAYWDWDRPAGGLYVPLTYTYWAGIPLPHRALAQVDLQEGKYQQAIDEARTAISVASPDENLRQEYLIQYLARRHLTTQPVQGSTKNEPQINTDEHR